MKVNNRNFMRSTIAFFCVIIFSMFVQTSFAQDAAQKNTGEKVWLNMTQKELDDAYDQRVYAANMAQVNKRYTTNSEDARAVIGNPKRVAYGNTEIEKLDIFVTDKKNAPIQIFIHGGAWRSGNAAGYSFLAEPFMRAGAHFVIPDFSFVQNHNGNLLPMADQVRRAVAWVYRNASQFGGNPNRIYVSGHSSGGHLAGILLTTDWKKDFGLPTDVIKGGTVISGMFDLKPVRLSARSSYVKITDDIEDKLSSQRHIDLLNAPIIVAYGELETPEFLRQSRDFVQAVKATGKPVQEIMGRGYNHFEVLETLANPYSPLTRAVLKQMKLD